MKLTYNLFFRPQTKVGKCKYSNIRASVYIFLVYTWNENRKLSFDFLGMVFMTYSVRTISKGPCIKLYDLRSFFPLSDCLTSYFLIYGWSSENCRRRKVFWNNLRAWLYFGALRERHIAEKAKWNFHVSHLWRYLTFPTYDSELLHLDRQPRNSLP